MKKCADYFQAESGVREFGKICVSTKCTRISQSSLVMRSMEVKYKDVSRMLIRCLFMPGYYYFFLRIMAFHFLFLSYSQMSFMLMYLLGAYMCMFGVFLGNATKRGNISKMILNIKPAACVCHPWPGSCHKSHLLQLLFCFFTVTSAPNFKTPMLDTPGKEYIMSCSFSCFHWTYSFFLLECLFCFPTDCCVLKPQA